MEANIRRLLDGIRSGDSAAQNAAYLELMALTEQPVDWAYGAWDELLEGLRHKDNHVRAISAQVLSNLAKSDPEQRMCDDFAALLVITHDERFVTARHCLQSLWKVGAAGPEQLAVYLDGLERRYHDCAAEKNRTLIRYDIIQSLRDVHNAGGQQQADIRSLAIELIGAEPDPKYRKKYAGVWRNA